MANEAWFLGKSLPTDIADVRPLAHVYQYMLLLGGQTRECLPTNWTGKGLDSRMDHHVHIKGIFLAEGLAAGRTDVPLLGLVAQHVLVQIILRGHPAFAEFALELRLVVSIFLMAL